MSRKPISQSQAVCLLLLWAVLCYIVLSSVPRIDGPLLLSIVISGALVFIPICKSFRKR